MINDSLISKFSDKYENILKIAKIRKLPNGKYRVLSKKNKNLGTYNTKAQAKKRLNQVEFFKFLDKLDTNDSLIDLTEVDEFSYSAMIRKLREKASKEQVIEFLTIYKKNFDRSIKNRLQKPEKIALQKTVIEFNKLHKIKLNKEIIKNAAVSELGNPQVVGKYLSNIVKFIMNKISQENRQKSINNLKNKFYYMNENEIASKKMPASSALGQSITFVKHVLFNHDSRYIREVLNSLVKNL